MILATKITYIEPNLLKLLLNSKYVASRVGLCAVLSTCILNKDLLRRHKLLPIAADV